MARGVLYFKQNQVTVISKSNMSLKLNFNLFHNIFWLLSYSRTNILFTLNDIALHSKRKINTCIPKRVWTVKDSHINSMEKQQTRQS